MNKNDISIATITWARDDQEEQLLRQSLQHLAALSVPVFITDAGSGAGFVDFLHSFPHFTISEGRGVWPQAKASLSKALSSGSAFILYTEPDKSEFFHRYLPEMLQQTAVDEQSGIVLASRSARAFATFPPFQQMTETTINNCCREMIGGQYDYTYGPFLLNRKLVPNLDVLPDDAGWGWRPYAFGLAHRLGYTVTGFTGDFTCPEDQRHDNEKERLYRMRQLAQNIQGLVLSASVQQQLPMP